MRLLLILLICSAVRASEVKGRLFLSDEENYVQEKHSPYQVWNNFQQHETGPVAEAKVDPVAAVIGGISSLSWIAKAGVAIIFLPFVLTPLIFIFLLIYFIPVLKINLGPEAVGRKWGQVGQALTHLEGTARFLYALPTQEQCLEKAACQVGRAVAFHPPILTLLQAKLESFENLTLKRLGRSLQFASEGSCGLLKCRMKRQFDYISKWIPLFKTA